MSSTTYVPAPYCALRTCGVLRPLHFLGRTTVSVLCSQLGIWDGMGAAASVTAESRPEELAGAVGSIAAAYSPYGERVLADGVDGQVVYGTAPDDLLDALEVKNILHRKRLKNEIEKLQNGEVLWILCSKLTRAGRVTPGPVERHADEGHHEGSLEDLIQRAKIIPEASPEGVVENIQHFFLSYRQKTETALVNSLYMGIKARVADVDFGVTGRTVYVQNYVSSLFYTN